MGLLERGEARLVGGGPAETETCTFGGAEVRWQFHTVYDWASDTVLDVPDGDPHTERVQQWHVNGGRNQQ